MERKKSIIIYISYICAMGGAETWVYNFTQAFKDYFDITVMYLDADKAQLDRLNVPHQRYNWANGIFYCDILLYQFGTPPHSIKARKTLHVIHFNYDQLTNRKFQLWGKVDGFIFPSQAAKDHFPIALNGRTGIVLGNPLATPTIPEKTKRKDKKLRILVASRLTKEKGGMRILELSRQLREAKIPYIIDVFTTMTEDAFYNDLRLVVHDENIIFHKPKIDIRQEMVDHDYVAQLSDSESFCYTIYEAIMLKTPVLVTDWDGVRNVVQDGENGYIVDMGLTNLKVKKLVKKKPNNFAIPPNDNQKWIDYLNGIDLSFKDNRSVDYRRVGGYIWNI